MWQPQGFYNEYALRTPVILSGEESVRGLYNYPAARIAVIYGGVFSDYDLFQSTFAKCDIKFIKRSWNGEPDMKNLSMTIKTLTEYNPDTIIAIGGGSVIDGAKLCRLYYELPYYKHGFTRLSGDLLKTKFIAIPTTVGSGAEVSSAAVFWNDEKHCKDMVVLHELQPDVIVYDKRYTEGAPIRLTIASALDALAHILEGYVSNQSNRFIDVMAETGYNIICEELIKVLDNEVNTLDYQRLQYGGFIGGMVQNHCIVGAAHAIAHQLTEYGFSHGEAVALLIGDVVLLNSFDSKTNEKYSRIFQKSGYKNIESFIGFICSLCEFAGIATRKNELKSLLNTLKDDDLFRENVKNDRGGKGNPITITDEYLYKLIGRM